MKRTIGRLASKAMPRTYSNLQLLSTMNDGGESVIATLVSLDEQVRELRAELNEVRRDNRRVVELYDLVFARLQEDTPLKATALRLDVDPAEASVDRADDPKD
ncbi:hypothetical protein [Agromyces sp. NPDC058110]|uniref:hypothetical protein n=1 Tax=Agromyces sp. NPDC058110 TaxID=3346345 RepID=UPI0036D7D76D